MQDPRAELTQLARSYGFRAVRFATVGPTPHRDAYTRWLRSGHHGDMDYMVRSEAVRCEPQRRFEAARSAMVLSLEHHHVVPPDPGGLTGRVARYAWGRDYHNLVGKRLRKLKRDLLARGVTCWGGIDTAPILERSWAAEAGLGFGGKNCMQIVPARTSWMFLAVLFVDVEVEPDPPLRDHCGRCTRCLSGCPTEAFVGPRSLDARRCISYWTIEARELAPRALRQGFGRWVFGCDVCQEVCPHNVAAPEPDEDDLLPRHAWLDLPELLDTPDEALLERFRGTPLRRPKGHGLKRNALIVLANLGQPACLEVVERALSHDHDVVRAAAVWALGQLGDGVPAGHRARGPLEALEVVAQRAGPDAS